MEAIKGKVAGLIEVFQCAILDLAAKLEDEKSTMPAEDVENTKYVVGMAQVNSVNLQKVIEQGTAYYEANKVKMDAFIAEATVFAESLKKEGYGVMPEEVAVV